MAAQAPLASTANDFWRMVWEFKSRAIVMLCQLEENGQVREIFIEQSPATLVSLSVSGMSLSALWLGCACQLWSIA